MQENKKVLIYDGMIHEIKDLIRKQGSPGQRTQKKKNAEETQIGKKDERLERKRQFEFELENVNTKQLSEQQPKGKAFKVTQKQV